MNDRSANYESDVREPLLLDHMRERVVDKRRTCSTKMSSNVSGGISLSVFFSWAISGTERETPLAPAALRFPAAFSDSSAFALPTSRVSSTFCEVALRLRGRRAGGGELGTRGLPGSDGAGTGSRVFATVATGPSPYLSTPSTPCEPMKSTA